MRNYNGARYLVVLALLISVVALSLGFAAFSRTLTIKSSATVTNAQDAGVVLSTSTTAANTGNVTPTVSPSSNGPTGAVATLAADTISGLKATFTGTNQTVTYTFAARNTGAFTYYLNQVNFLNAEGSETTKVCTAKTGTTQSYVDAACNGITLSVKVGTSSAYTTTQASLSGHSLAKNTGEAVVVTITYANNASVADGDFDVAFGDIQLVYGTAD